MPSRPIETHPRRENRHKPTRQHPTKSSKYGHAHHQPHAASGTADVLLSIPSESLTHITSFLDPPDLLALARTCHQLNAHVIDDNTWRRAYVYQYLGILPESDIHEDAGDRAVLLRREESSWRKEFIRRYNLRRYVITFSGFPERRGKISLVLTHLSSLLCGGRRRLAALICLAVGHVAFSLALATSQTLEWRCFTEDGARAIAPMCPSEALPPSLNRCCPLHRPCDHSSVQSFTHRLDRRWEYSRNTTITHIPHHSVISALHLMPHTTLLAASLQYGVVSRSYPLSGKVLRGFLDASGTLNGLGIGNPNAEFSPHVSSIALASEGGTAKVLWGFRNGDVAVTTALRAMDHNRTSAARLVKCGPEDSHLGAVECVAWAIGSQGYAFLVSGGADGRVKLWEVQAAQLKCLWTSNNDSSLVPDPCIKIVFNSQRGIIASGMRSGTTLVWTGFDLQSTSSVPALEIHELRIPAPTSPTATASPVVSLPPLEDAQREITGLRIAPNDKLSSLLVTYRASPFFRRLSWDSISGAFYNTFFGDEGAGAITAVFPVWACQPEERDFVVAGDQLGNISIFPWDTRSLSPLSTSTSSLPANPSVHAVRRFGAHEDGAVTALAWNSAVLASGSSRGTIKVWDALTLAPLRSFPSPAARPFPGGEWDPVFQILLEPDTLIVSVGSRVLAWKAGPVGRSPAHGKGKMRALNSRSFGGVAKWQRE